VGRDGRRSYGRRNEEYAADFSLIARRTLSRLELRILNLHVLGEVEYAGCCAALGMDRGNFFHAVYRIQQKLGRAFRETRPYPLYPVRDYFSL